MGIAGNLLELAGLRNTPQALLCGASGAVKGITAAALGRLLKSRGYSVSIVKLDPYLNVDPGTMHP